MHTRPGPPRRADARRNAERIVRVAIDALGEGGGPVRLEELADRAGVAEATLYRLFGGRRGLMTEVLATFVTEQIEPLVGPPGPDPTAELATALAATVEVLAEHRALVRAAREAGPLGVGPVQGFLGRLAAVLAAAQEAGGVRPDATVRDLGAVLIMALAAVHEGDPAGADRRRALALLLAGLRPGGPPLPPPAPGNLLA
ncbi:helix-turn-helix domain-containing protein [Pseudonocardia xishanensis]|uniref:TetR/AcrR family transcriptional regulator n=1 Tax=Pseudonocardia xishanensis TaxID=630995 RepID=A0ABP8RXI1_9PSEU